MSTTQSDGVFGFRSAGYRVGAVVMACVFGPLAVLSVGAFGGACSCPPVKGPGLTVTVVDAAGGSMICDATVIAREGDYSETLVGYSQTAPSGASGCRYGGAYGRPGLYSISAMLGNRGKVVEGVRVASDECSGAKEHFVTIALDP